MSGDLAIEVALDIEYRIGRVYRCAKKFLRLRTYFLHKSKGTLTLSRACYKIGSVTVLYRAKMQARS